MEVVEAAFEMLKFSMGNTLVTFREKYYEYGVEDDPVMRALTIGGYDSAWYVNMVASYTLDLAKDHFSRTKFFGVYHNDGNVVFEGNRTSDKLQDWLHKLQDHVNIITDGNIQLTMEIWKPGEVSWTIEAKKIMIVGDSKFPYLDIDMSYDENKNLKFNDHPKPG